MPKHTELYERLELTADADEAAIKKAYRKVRAPPSVPALSPRACLCARVTLGVRWR